MDPEKITINLNAVDLGRIDLLVEEGFYSNRSDFIRTAIRKELDSQSDIIRQNVSRRLAVLGVAVFSRRELEESLQKKQRLDIDVVGGVHLAEDITPALAVDAIRRLRVRGVLRASQPVKDALAEGGILE